MENFVSEDTGAANLSFSEQGAVNVNTVSQNPDDDGAAEQGDENRGRSSFGKFKSASELLEAYNSLEKEFTKRSQRIKSLEREMTQSVQTPPKVYEQTDWRERVQNFLRENPSAVPFQKEIADVIVNEKLDGEPRCLELALAKVIIANYRSPKDLADDGDFLESHIYGNSQIRERIIKDYLMSLSQTSAPKTIGRGGQAALAPLKRPNSFSEAGEMTLSLGKKGK